MLSRGAAPGGAAGLSKAACALNRALPSLSESRRLDCQRFASLPGAGDTFCQFGRNFALIGFPSGCPSPGRTRTGHEQVKSFVDKYFMLEIGLTFSFNSIL